MFKIFFWICALLPSLSFATYLEPWLTDELIFQAEGDYSFQSFRRLATGFHTKKYRADNNLEHASLILAGFTYSAEAEVFVADTRYHSFYPDSVKLTLRKQLLNDIVDDPFSLTAGVTFTEVFPLGLRDVSTIHHGRFETEVNVSIGQETSKLDNWLTHFWSVLGLGLASQGSPWLRADLFWEKNYCDGHRLRFFSKTLWGFGEHRLHFQKHFRGYGAINHQSIDIGSRYTYVFDYGINASFEYIFRAFSRNCPQNVNVIQLRILYPFGI